MQGASRARRARRFSPYTCMQEDHENPAELARSALRRLAEQGVAPTPRHFRRAYFEQTPHGAALSSGALLRRLERLPLARSPAWPQLREALTSEHWELALDLMAGLLLDSQPVAAAPAPVGAAVGAFVREWSRSQASLSHLSKLQALQAVEATRDNAELERLLHDTAARWSALADRALPSSAEAPAAAAIGGGEPWRRAWADALRMVEHSYADAPQLRAQAGELLRLATELDASAERLQAPARALWKACEDWHDLSAQTRARLLEAMRLLLDNVSELFDPGHWLQTQIGALRALLLDPPDVPRLAQAVAQLKDLLFRQGVLARAEEDARAVARELFEMVVRSLGTYAESTARYGNDLNHGLRELDDSLDWERAKPVVQSILASSRRMLDDTHQLRASFAEAQSRLEQAQARTRSLEAELHSVSELVHLDPLTAALNRRGLEAAFRNDVARAQRQGDTLCLAIIDLDHFKRVNDNYGHDLGDAVLKELVRVARTELRPSDSVARLGGEEFMLVLPGASLEQAGQTVARLKQRFHAVRFQHPRNADGVQVAFSAGLALWHPEEGFDAVYARADQALLQAKRAGRDRVQLAEAD